MRHDLTVEAAGVRLRPVRRDDAGFILSLRTDPDLARFLHPVAGGLAGQLAWMDAYFERAGDYYFLVERVHDGRPLGTIALVDVTGPGGDAEWGRWILAPGTLAAVPSALLIYRAAFDVLQLAEVRCLTVADNGRVVSFHDSCGLERVGTLAGHFQLGGRSHDAVHHRLVRDRWPSVEEALAPKAARLHALQRRGR